MEDLARRAKNSRRAKRPPVYLSDALGDDVIRERGELLLQLVEQLHDSDVRAVALPHRGPPSSWQGLPAGARHYRYITSVVASTSEDSRLPSPFPPHHLPVFRGRRGDSDRSLIVRRDVTGPR